MEETEWELVVCEGELNVVAVVLSLTGVEASEIPAVLDESVLVVRRGDSGGVSGIFCG